MSTTFDSYPVRRDSLTGRIAAEAASMLVSSARRRLRLWHDRRHLRELPDYILKDIGISRAEIDSVTEFGRDFADRKRR